MTDEKQKLLFSSNLSRLIEERNLTQAEIAEYISKDGKGSENCRFFQRS